MTHNPRSRIRLRGLLRGVRGEILPPDEPRGPCWVIDGRAAKGRTEPEITAQRTPTLRGRLEQDQVASRPVRIETVAFGLALQALRSPIHPCRLA